MVVCWCKDSFLPQVAAKNNKAMQVAYPELEDRRDYILKMIGIEEERFQSTLDQGLGYFRSC